MRKIEILVDEDRVREGAAKYPYLFGKRFANFLLGHFDGSATQDEFRHFREIGLTVSIDGFPAYVDASDEERAMQPLWLAVNAIHGWAQAEPDEAKRRWYLRAEEAALTAIHRVRQGQRGDAIGLAMDEFLHAVWGLAGAMHEKGVTADTEWYGQEYARVVQALRARGLLVGD